jgi:hypothetical protein
VLYKRAHIDKGKSGPMLYGCCRHNGCGVLFRAEAYGFLRWCRGEAWQFCSVQENNWSGGTGEKTGVKFLMDLGCSLCCIRYERGSTGCLVFLASRIQTILMQLASKILIASPITLKLQKLVGH